MTTVTLTPIDLSDATQIGKHTFRKQILKRGTIKYKGKSIPFDDALLSRLAKNFKRGAFDQVPFQFANDKNEHNEDPERFRGELTGVELTQDGLDGIFTLTSKAIKVIKDNPRLGVSARIVSGIEHADGRKFGPSIRHVLATMNPRVTGMRPWQAMDLSEDDETEVVDLTAANYQEGNTMAKKQAKGRRPESESGVISVTVDGKDRQIDLSRLSDEDFEDLLVDLSADDEDDDTEDEDDDADDDEDTGVVDVTDEVEDDEDDEDEDDDTSLSVVDDKKSKGKDKGKKVAKKVAAKPKTGNVDLSLAERLAQSEWRRERRELARAGVPPYMLDLAEPVLSSADAILLDLSHDDSEKVDAGDIIRQILEKSKGIIDIKPEVGHSVDLSLTEDEQDPSKAFLDEWDKQYGKA